MANEIQMQESENRNSYQNIAMHGVTLDHSFALI